MRLRHNLSGELLLALTAFRGVLGQQLDPRQAASTTSPAGSSSTSKAPTTSSFSIPPCCVIWPGFQGVNVNSWYSETVKQYTATVVTTFVSYSNTIVAANSSTIYAPKNDTFTAFGYYGPAGSNPFSVTGLTAVPTTLVPSDLLHDGEYAATTVVRGNETVVTFPFTDLKIAAPTAYALFRNVLLHTWTADYGVFATLTAPPSTYDRNWCGTSTQVAWLAYVSGSWITTTTSAFVPSSTIVQSMFNGFNGGGDIASFPVVVPLQTPMPNQRVVVDLPAGVSSSIVANKTIASLYPWVTNCMVYGGEGEPTVHVPVDQLTADSSVTVQGTVASAVVTTSTTSSTPPPAVNKPTSTSSNTPEQVKPTTAPNPTPSSTPNNTPNSTPAATPNNTPNSSPQPNNAGSSSSPAGASQGGVTSQEGSGGSQTTSQGGNAPAPSTTGNRIIGQTTTQVVSYQPLGTTAAVIGSTTLSVGAAVTQNGETLSLITQSSGVAVVVDGTATYALSSNAAASGSQILTLVGSSNATPTAAVVNGVTVKSGAATVIDGQTVSLAGTNIVIASGTATTTKDLGGVILNGLNGPPGSSGSSTGAPYTGAGVRLHDSLGRVFRGFLLLAFSYVLLM